MSRRTKTKSDPWLVLDTLIESYAEATQAESWKGGGDPADVPIVEARLTIARCELHNHLRRMRADLE